MFDPALFASMTWLDWAIIGVPVFFVLVGGLIGGTSLMLFGLVRLLTALPIAGLPVAYVAMRQKPLIQQMAQRLGVAPAEGTLIVMAVMFVVALIIAYLLLGILWRTLRGLLSSSTVGQALDRLIGIPFGLFAGSVLCAIFVLSPAVQFRSTIPQPDQPPGLRNSVLMPTVEEQVRALIPYLPSPS